MHQYVTCMNIFVQTQMVLRSLVKHRDLQRFTVHVELFVSLALNVNCVSWASDILNECYLLRIQTLCCFQVRVDVMSVANWKQARSLKCQRAIFASQKNVQEPRLHDHIEPLDQRWLFLFVQRRMFSKCHEGKIKSSCNLHKLFCNPHVPKSSATL